MKFLIAGFLGLATMAAPSVKAEQIEGPARFCGYSPIIDLLPGEKVTTFDGEIHGGRFQWQGAFGVLEVYGIGWAGRPKGQIVISLSPERPARFVQRRVSKHYQVAIWNGSNGAAYFRSPKPLTSHKLDAIDRVRLFEEGQTPANCNLRTVFSWD